MKKPHIKRQHFWSSTPPTHDDLTGDPIQNVFYDANTMYGSWAIMTPETFNRVGMGLGSGLGQKYELQPDGRWLKTEG